MPLIAKDVTKETVTQPRIATPLTTIQRRRKDVEVRKLIKNANANTSSTVTGEDCAQNADVEMRDYVLEEGEIPTMFTESILRKSKDSSMTADHSLDLRHEGLVKSGIFKSAMVRSVFYLALLQGPKAY